ncbi:MAG: adenosylcobinamide-GDP ribazoletransferase [Candidatus Omnitrophica bacterium]|nr:adenosylcobinamide-GDP ribazoletransferase [Candidatus Omnitrophota bacterium]
MKNFILALQFLTTISFKTKKVIDSDRLLQATIYFPLVGLLLGLILAAVNILFSYLGFSQLLTNTALVTLLIILTGGLHLDGLADTFDALLSRKGSLEMLEIMRDSHIGTMGVLSLITIILFKISLLGSLDFTTKNITLLLMCFLSRYSLVAAMFLFPYARQQGKAKIFMAGMDFRIFFLATLTTLALVIILWQIKGLFCLALVVVFVFLSGKFITKKIGGITGDSLGAMNELGEVLVLFVVFLLNRSLS